MMESIASLKIQTFDWLNFPWYTLLLGVAHFPPRYSLLSWMRLQWNGIHLWSTFLVRSSHTEVHLTSNLLGRWGIMCRRIVGKSLDNSFTTSLERKAILEKWSRHLTMDEEKIGSVPWRRSFLHWYYVLCHRYYFLMNFRLFYEFSAASECWNGAETDEGKLWLMTKWTSAGFQGKRPSLAYICRLNLALFPHNTLEETQTLSHFSQHNAKRNRNCFLQTFLTRSS